MQLVSLSIILVWNYLVLLSSGSIYRVTSVDTEERMSIIVHE
jgi:hypothetical protein